MVAPVSGLDGDGPYQPACESLQQYEVLEWYRDAKFGTGLIGARNVYPKMAADTRATCTPRGSTEPQVPLGPLAAPKHDFGNKDLCAQQTMLIQEPDALIQLYKDAGARLFIALANQSRRWTAI